MTSTKMPIASSGLRPSARRSSARKPPWFSNSAESTAIARSGTFSHPDVCRRHDGFGKRQALHIRCRLNAARLFTSDRQAHRDARSRADAAADRKLSAVKFDQPLDDRESKPCSVVGAIIGGAHPEEPIADLAPIAFADSDAGVFHREDHMRARG